MLTLRLLEHVTQFLPLAPCVDVEHRLDRIEKRRLFLHLLVECLVKCSESKTSSPDLAARYVGDLLDRIDMLIRMNGMIIFTQFCELIFFIIGNILLKARKMRKTKKLKFCWTNLFLFGITWDVGSFSVRKLAFAKFF